MVYSEMQGRENTPGDLIGLRYATCSIHILLTEVTHRMSRLLNNLGSAYRSETGGLMEALRSLTIEQSEDTITFTFISMTFSSSGLPPNILCTLQPLSNHCRQSIHPISSQCPSRPSGTFYYWSSTPTC